MQIFKSLSEFIYNFQSLIGAIVGSALAALIAYISIKKTHQNQIDLENEKIKVERYQEEKVYCGYLYSIWAAMQGQIMFINAIKKEIDFILVDFRKSGEIPYDKPYNVLPIELVKESYFRILSYEKYNSKIINKLVFFLSINDSLTNELNFIVLKKLKLEIHAAKEYQARVEFYFNQLIGHLNVLLDTAKEIENKIMEDLIKSNTSNIFFEEANKIKAEMKSKEAEDQCI